MPSIIRFPFGRHGIGLVDHPRRPTHRSDPNVVIGAHRRWFGLTGTVVCHMLELDLGGRPVGDQPIGVGHRHAGLPTADGGVGGHIGDLGVTQGCGGATQPTAAAPETGRGQSRQWSGSALFGSRRSVSCRPVRAGGGDARSQPGLQGSPLRGGGARLRTEPTHRRRGAAHGWTGVRRGPAGDHLEGSGARNAGDRRPQELSRTADRPPPISASSIPRYSTPI